MGRCHYIRGQAGVNERQRLRTDARREVVVQAVARDATKDDKTLLQSAYGVCRGVKPLCRESEGAPQI